MKQLAIYSSIEVCLSVFHLGPFMYGMKKLHMCEDVHPVLDGTTCAASQERRPRQVAEIQTQGDREYSSSAHDSRMTTH